MYLSSSARFVIEKLTLAGHHAYVVGGCVRDFYMGKTPSDFDSTTDALPSSIKEVFSDFKTIDTGLRHGTVSVKIENDLIEITTHRHDGDYHDHRRPDTVIFTHSLEKDLARRDFTVNAMAYNDSVGVVDIFGGREDIENKIIRCVGDPELRFEEDALRILRALRFASLCDFEIEENTKKAIFEKSHLLTFVSKERITEELRKFVLGKGAGRLVKEYGEVFSKIFEEIELKTQIPFDKVESPCLKLALLFIYSKNRKEYLKKLTLVKEDRAVLEDIFTLFEKEMIFTKGEIRKLISKKGERTALLFAEMKLALSQIDERVMREFVEIISKGDYVTLSTLSLKGDDLVDVAENKDIGKILNFLVDAVCDEKVENEKTKLKEYITYIYP